MAGGRAPETPVALIRYATTAQQEVLVTTLGKAAEDVAESGIKPPAVTVVGDVVRLREQLAHGASRPLLGKSVLITRPAAQAEEFAELLRAEGAEPVIFPLIHIVPLEDEGLLQDVISRLDSFDWLFFTSANGVRIAEPYLGAALSPSATPVKQRVKVAAVGPRTAQVCRELGFEIAFIPDEYAVEAIVEQFPEDVEGKRILLLRAREGNPALPNGLRARGAIVEDIPIYSAEPVDADPAQLREMLGEKKVDVVTLMSSSTARSLVSLLGKDASAILQGVCVACLGHVTAQTYRELTGRTPDVQAGVYTMQGLIQALVNTQREVDT